MQLMQKNWMKLACKLMLHDTLLDQDRLVLNVANVHETE